MKFKGLVSPWDGAAMKLEATCTYNQARTECWMWLKKWNRTGLSLPELLNVRFKTEGWPKLEGKMREYRNRHLQKKKKKIKSYTICCLLPLPFILVFTLFFLSCTLLAHVPRGSSSTGLRGVSWAVPSFSLYKQVLSHLCPLWATWLLVLCERNRGLLTLGHGWVPGGQGLRGQPLLPNRDRDVRWGKGSTLTNTSALVLDPASTKCVYKHVTLSFYLGLQPSQFCWACQLHSFVNSSPSPWGRIQPQAVLERRGLAGSCPGVLTMTFLLAVRRSSFCYCWCLESSRVWE